MFKLSSQLNIGHLFGARKKKVVRKGDVYPVREWLFGLLVFLVLVISGGLYSTYQFLEYKNIHIGEGVFNGKIPSYEWVLAEQALEIFKNRIIAHEALKASGIAVEQIQIFEEVISTSSSEVIRETAATSSAIFDGVE